MKAKNVGRKEAKLESYRHGVRVRGMQLSKRVDGESGSAITGSAVPSPNPSFTAVRKEKGQG